MGGPSWSVESLALPPDSERPLCTPFASPPGRWVLDAQDRANTDLMTWVTDHEEEWAAGNTSRGAPCRWLVPDSAAFAECAAGRTVVIAGDSVQRYAWIFLSNDISGCDAPGAPDPWSANASAVCPYIDAMKLAKSDGFVSLAPRAAPRGAAHLNVTLPYRYLRFAYEFFDRTGAWQPDYLREPGAADAVVLGGLGYWDARYGTVDVLENVFARFADDFRERVLSRNPRLADRLVVTSTSYAENFDARLGMFPDAALDRANAAARAAWTAAGVRWFDTRKYTRVARAEQHAARGAAGGKLLTMDGYHPVRRVQQAIAREWASFVCALPPRARDAREAPAPARGGAEGAAALRAARRARAAPPQRGAAAEAHGDGTTPALAALAALTLWRLRPGGGCRNWRR
jgi:hypothetical protein